MTDLTDFLLARIAERERKIHELMDLHEDVQAGRVVIGETASWKHEAVVKAQAVGLPHLDELIAECEAKRNLVERAVRAFESTAASDAAWHYAVGMNDALRSAALPYADHPEYDESWRP